VLTPWKNAMTTQSYTTFPQTHHITSSLVNFQSKKITIVYIKKMADPVSMAVLFFSHCQLFFPLFLLSLPKIRGRQYRPRPLCSETLSDNYVTNRIVSKTGWNQWKERTHVVEGPRCVVYCHGCETSINLSCVLLTCFDPRPGPATPQLAPPLITVSILVTSSTSKTFGWLSNPVTKINIDAFLTYNVPHSSKFGRCKPVSIW